MKRIYNYARGRNTRQEEQQAPHRTAAATHDLEGGGHTKNASDEERQLVDSDDDVRRKGIDFDKSFWERTPPDEIITLAVSGDGSAVVKHEKFPPASRRIWADDSEEDFEELDNTSAPSNSKVTLRERSASSSSHAASPEPGSSPVFLSRPPTSDAASHTRPRLRLSSQRSMIIHPTRPMYWCHARKDWIWSNRIRRQLMAEDGSFRREQGSVSSSAAFDGDLASAISSPISPPAVVWEDGPRSRTPSLAGASPMPLNRLRNGSRSRRPDSRSAKYEGSTSRTASASRNEAIPSPASTLHKVCSRPHKQHPTRPLHWCFDEERWIWPGEAPHTHSPTPSAIVVDGNSGLDPGRSMKGTVEDYLARKLVNAHHSETRSLTPKPSLSSAGKDEGAMARSLEEEARRVEPPLLVWHSPSMLPPAPTSQQDKDTRTPPIIDNTWIDRVGLPPQKMRADDRPFAISRPATAERTRTPSPDPNGGLIPGKVSKDPEDPFPTPCINRVATDQARSSGPIRRRVLGPKIEQSNPRMGIWITLPTLRKTFAVSDDIGGELSGSPRWKLRDYETFLDDEVESLDLSQLDVADLILPAIDHSSMTSSPVDMHEWPRFPLLRSESSTSTERAEAVKGEPNTKQSSPQTRTEAVHTALRNTVVTSDDTSEELHGSLRWKLCDDETLAHEECEPLDLSRDRQFDISLPSTVTAPVLDQSKRRDLSLPPLEPEGSINAVEPVEHVTRSHFGARSPLVLTPPPPPIEDLNKRIAALEAVLATRAIQQTEHTHTISSLTAQVADLRTSLTAAFGGFDRPTHDLRKRYPHSRAEVRKLTVQVKELEQQRRGHIQELTRTHDTFTKRFAAHERSLLALYDRQAKTEIVNRENAEDGQAVGGANATCCRRVEESGARGRHRMCRPCYPELQSDVSDDGSVDGGVPLNDTDHASYEDLRLLDVSSPLEADARDMTRAKDLIAAWEGFAAIRS